MRPRDEPARGLPLAAVRKSLDSVENRCPAASHRVGGPGDDRSAPWNVVVVAVVEMLSSVGRAKIGSGK